MRNKQIHNKDLVPLAKILRSHMTREEKHLWYDYLRNYPLRFIRQKTIGNHIADFYCAKAKLVIELDGSQHYSDSGRLHDTERDTELMAYGIRVLHISNHDINTNFEGSCIEINKRVRETLGYDPLENELRKMIRDPSQEKEEGSL